jgi:rhodanese-related sulfurtransferase
MRELPLSVRAISLLMAAAAACAAPHPIPSGTAAAPASRRVDGPTARALAKNGAKVVDVRRPDEFALGHVPGAANIPYDEIAARTAEIGPKDAEVIVYCGTGRRSALAAMTLEGLGYTKVHDLGPMSAWSAEAPATPQ